MQVRMAIQSRYGSRLGARVAGYETTRAGKRHCFTLDECDLTLLVATIISTAGVWLALA
jgi:hypothetical protein